MFFWKACIKENDVLTFLILRLFFFWTIFLTLKRISFFTQYLFFAEVYMPNAICDLILYLQSDGLNISWISRYNSIPVLKNGIRNTVFYSVASRLLWYIVYIMIRMGLTGQMLEPGIYCDFALVYYHYYYFRKGTVMQII